jgi:hypothetical protein
MRVGGCKDKRDDGDEANKALKTVKCCEVWQRRAKAEQVGEMPNEMVLSVVRLLTGSGQVEKERERGWAGGRER